MAWLSDIYLCVHSNRLQRGADVRFNADSDADYNALTIDNNPLIFTGINLCGNKRGYVLDLMLRTLWSFIANSSEVNNNIHVNNSRILIIIEEVI